MDIKKYVKNLIDPIMVKKEQPLLAGIEGTVNDTEEQYQFNASKIFNRDKSEQVDINNEPDQMPQPTPKDYRQKDKVALDLLIAVDQMMSARDFLRQNVDDLKDRLKHSEDHIKKLTEEKVHLEQVIALKDSEIARLEDQIANRNLNYDQLMEDYQEMQSRLNYEIEELKNSIYIEQERYKKLNESYENLQIENISKVRQLEDKIRELETKNENLQNKYYKIREENVYLLGMFKDFNNRMSSSFKGYDIETEMNKKVEENQKEEVLPKEE